MLSKLSLEGAMLLATATEESRLKQDGMRAVELEFCLRKFARGECARLGGPG